MAQCKDCIHGEVCDIFVHTRTLICNDNADKMCKMFKPTADVVPKSEVDDWIVTAKENLIRIEELENTLKQAKAEVAQEIFEEIKSKKRFLRYGFGNTGVIILFKDIAELEKIYTEAKE